MGVDEAAIKAAIKRRQDYILENVETMSLKSCRQTLEEDMGLDAGALKPYKELLSTLIDTLLAKQRLEAAPAEEAAEAAPASDGGKKKQRRKKAAAAASDDAEDADEEEKPRKRSKQEGKPAKASAPRQHSARVEKLKRMCRAATITIPPTLYVKNKEDAALQAALEDLLDKHGLDASAGEREIARVKAKLQQQRDLDGIDSSNIIEGGRCRRAAAPTSYRGMVEPPSDSEQEEVDQQEEEESSDSGSEGEEAAAPAAKTGGKKGKAKTKPAAASESEASGANSSEEEAEEDEEEAAGGSAAKPSPASKAAKAAAAAKSPDENHAARGNGGSGGKGGKSASKGKPQRANDGWEEDSDGSPAGAKPGKRRVVADWSDDD